MGKAFFFQKKFEEAAVSYEQALHWDPHYAMAYVNLGELFLSQGKQDEAMSFLQKALRISPNDRRARELLKKAESLHK